VIPRSEVDRKEIGGIKIKEKNNRKYVLFG